MIIRGGTVQLLSEPINTIKLRQGIKLTYTIYGNHSANASAFGDINRKVALNVSLFIRCDFGLFTLKTLKKITMRSV